MEDQNRIQGDNMELEIGKKVFVLSIGNRKRYQEVKEAEVEKIGRKYFYLKGFSCKFSKESLEDVTDFSSDYRVYTSRKELEEFIEFEKLKMDIAKTFSHRSARFRKLTLDQARRIMAIIKENDER